MALSNTEIALIIVLIVMAIYVYSKYSKKKCIRIKKIYDTSPKCGAGTGIFDLGYGEPGLKKLNDLETDISQIPTYRKSKAGYTLPNITEAGWLTTPSHASFGKEERGFPLQNKFDSINPLRTSVISEIARSLNMHDIIRIVD